MLREETLLNLNLLALQRSVDCPVVFCVCMCIVVHCQLVVSFLFNCFLFSPLLQWNNKESQPSTDCMCIVVHCQLVVSFLFNCIAVGLCVLHCNCKHVCEVQQSSMNLVHVCLCIFVHCQLVVSSSIDYSLFLALPPLQRHNDPPSTKSPSQRTIQKMIRGCDGAAYDEFGYDLAVEGTGLLSVQGVCLLTLVQSTCTSTTVTIGFLCKVLLQVTELHFFLVGVAPITTRRRFSSVGLILIPT